MDFSATWCGPCQMIGPFFATLSEQFENVIFVKVDVDKVEVSSAWPDLLSSVMAMRYHAACRLPQIRMAWGCDRMGSSGGMLAPYPRDV